LTHSDKTDILRIPDPERSLSGSFFAGQSISLLTGKLLKKVFQIKDSHAIID
jgi:hypothetical protein